MRTLLILICLLAFTGCSETKEFLKTLKDKAAAVFADDEKK